MGTPLPANQLAATYLKALGAPVTPGNVRALSAWFAIESGWFNSSHGTVNVVGNNPLNITGTGNCGSRNYAGHTFAVFCTPEEGAQRWASNITSSWGKHYGYDAIASALMNGGGNNGETVITAIIGSGWVTGKRGNQYYQPKAGFNSLISVFNSKAAINIAGDAGSSMPQPLPLNTDTLLGGWQNWVTFPIGHQLSETDVEQIISILDSHGTFNGPGGDVAKNQVRDILLSHVGQAWNKSLQDTLQQEFLNKAAKDNGPNPLTIAAEFLSALGNPVTWVRLASGIGGGILIVFGLYVISKSAINSADFQEPATQPVVILKQ